MSDFVAVKTADLTGTALNWAVSISKGDGDWDIAHESGAWNPAHDWAQGGPLIEDNGISVIYDVELCEEEGRNYRATMLAVDSHEGLSYGSTPLIAGMRCVVENALGNEVSIPRYLVGLAAGVEVVGEGRFLGKVTSVGDYFVVQDAGRGRLVAHEAHKFAVLPVLGVVIDLAHKGDKVEFVNVVEVGKEGNER